MYDKCFLSATMLDPRNESGRNITATLLQKANDALLLFFQDIYNDLEEKRLLSASLEAETLSNSQVVESDIAKGGILTNSLLSSILCGPVKHVIDDSPVVHTYNKPNEEVMQLYSTTQGLGLFGKRQADPIKVHESPETSLWLARLGALNLQAMPVVKALSDRIFFIALRFTFNDGQRHIFDRIVQ